MDKRQIIDKIQAAYIPGACSIGDEIGCEAVKEQFSKATVALVIQELSRIIFTEIKDNGSFTFPGVGTLVLQGDFMDWDRGYNYPYATEEEIENEDTYCGQIERTESYTGRDCPLKCSKSECTKSDCPYKKSE